MEKIVSILGWVVLITLSLGIARQLSEQKTIDSFPVGNSLPYYKLDKRLLEQFENTQSSPADIKSDYKLLSDVLAPSRASANLTAKTCYEKDFLSQTAKTGNYIQRTNNFRHAAPDNCSSPLTEFVDNFYSNP